MNAQFFEQHHRLTKMLYARTSKRIATFTEEIIKQQHAVDLARELDTVDLGLESTEYKLAYRKAANTSKHQLTSSCQSHSLAVLRNPQAAQAEEHLTNKTKATLELLRHQPEVALLPQLFAEHCEREGWAFNQDLSIEACKSGVLAASKPWKADYDLQSVHAFYDFHKAPYFDSVKVNAGDGLIWFAQLRVMFRAKVMTPKGADTKQFAMVRWYMEQHPQHKLSSMFQCVSMQWEVYNNAARYQIIDLESVECKEYIVPDFTRNHKKNFFVNAFKWSRPVFSLAKDQ